MARLHPFARALLCLTAFQAAAARGEETPRAAQGAAAGTEAASRAAALRSRVLELEEAIRRAAAPREGAARGVPGSSAPVHTTGMAEAARRYKPGALDPESLTRLTNLVARRDGPAIAAEIEKHLLGGEAGFAFLCELLRKFDEDFKVGGLFAADYRITFSLTMLAMLHEVETAGFAHYYLVVTRDEPNAFLRQKLYDFIPVMLQFYRGRFPDLEDAFRSDIVEKLQAGKGDVQRLFTAMRALGFQLDLETAWKMLSAASDLQHVTLLVNHIADRNDEGAVQALTRFIDRKDDFQSSHVHLALAALARMSTPEAERVLLNRYLSGRRRDAVEPATRAYFAVPREPTAATLALRFLNSPETDLKGKEAFINFLRQKNPLVLEELRKRAAEISSEPVRAPVLR